MKKPTENRNILYLHLFEQDSSAMMISVTAGKETALSSSAREISL
jgi:hypothetical protein